MAAESVLDAVGGRDGTAPRVLCGGTGDRYRRLMSGLQLARHSQLAGVLVLLAAVVAAPATSYAQADESVARSLEVPDPDLLGAFQIETNVLDRLVHHVYLRGSIGLGSAAVPAFSQLHSDSVVLGPSAEWVVGYRGHHRGGFTWRVEAGYVGARYEYSDYFEDGLGGRWFDRTVFLHGASYALSVGLPLLVRPKVRAGSFSPSGFVRLGETDYRGRGSYASFPATTVRHIYLSAVIAHTGTFATFFPAALGVYHPALVGALQFRVEDSQRIRFRFRPAAYYNGPKGAGTYWYREFSYWSLTLGGKFGPANLVGGFVISFEGMAAPGIGFRIAAEIGRYGRVGVFESLLPGGTFRHEYGQLSLGLYISPPPIRSRLDVAIPVDRLRTGTGGGR